MQEETAAFMEIIGSLVSIHRKHRQKCNQFQTLPKNIFRRRIVRFCIIRIQGEHTSSKRIHQIRTWCFHNDITDKAGRQTLAVFGKNVLQIFQLALCRQFTKEQKIYHFFIAETFFLQKSIDNLFDIDSLIIQFSFARNHIMVNDSVRTNLGNLRQSGKYTLTV